MVLFYTRKTISIHVLRVEDDQVHARKVHRQGISIHVLRVEDDLSTSERRSIAADFNPRPPCGGRRKRAAHRAMEEIISIHVLRVEDD